MVGECYRDNKNVGFLGKDKSRGRYPGHDQIRLNVTGKQKRWQRGVDLNGAVVKNSTNNAEATGDPLGSIPA